MGRVIPIGDAEALAQAVIEIWKKKVRQRIKIQNCANQYSPDSIAAQFEALFEEIKGKKEIILMNE